MPQDPQVVQAVSAPHSLGRLGEADDIAKVAAWLRLRMPEWVTGQYIEASGGSGLVNMIGKWILIFGVVLVLLGAAVG